MKLNEKQTFLIIILITLSVLTLPLIIRHYEYNSVLLGEDPYYHMRMAEHIAENRWIPDKDPLVERSYTLNPYHIILAISSSFISLEASSKIIPLLLGMITILFFYLILKSSMSNKMNRLMIVLLFATSPLFIFTFTTSNHYSLILFLNILGFYFFMQKKPFFTLLTLFAFSVIPFFNFFNALITIILLLIFTLSTRSDIKKFYIVSIGVMIKTTIFHITFFQNYGLPQKIPFITRNILQESLSDLGALMGFGTFILFLALIGLIVTWKKQKEYTYIYPFTILLVIISFFLGTYTNIYLNVIVCILAGFGIFTLLKRRWELKLIKNLTLIILVCGLLFSTISYISRFSNFQPDQDVINSLEWLNKNSANNEKVFSHYKNGFWIEAIAKRPILLDNLYPHIDDALEKFSDSQKIFYSMSLKETKSLLKKQNITYIWIDKPMKSGLVWTEEKQGLLFLFQNNETFKKVYNHTSIEIWEFIK